MSNTAENPEFETFMNGLQTLKGQGEDKYIESLIMSIIRLRKALKNMMVMMRYQMDVSVLCYLKGNKEIVRFTM